MNCRPFIIIGVLAVTAALFQWQQHRGLAEQETTLLSEIRRIHTEKTAPVAAALLDKSGLQASAAASTAGADFDPVEFAASLAALVPLLDKHGGPRDPQAREKLEKRAFPLMAQLDIAPVDDLKQACTLLLRSTEVPESMKSEFCHLILAEVAKHDPAWAAERALKLRSSHVLENIIQIGSGKKTAATLAWLEAAEKDGTLAASGSNIAHLRSVAATSQAYTDPIGALEKLPELDPEVAGRTAFYLASALRTPGERTGALESIATRMDKGTLKEFASSLGAATGFEAARDALGAAQLSPQLHDVAAAAIASGAVGPQSAEHAAWLVENLRSPEAEPLRRFVQKWTQGDFNGTGTWLKSLPQGPRRDQAIDAFAQEVAASEPPSAADWAATISDPAARSDTLRKVWDTWHSADAPAAQAYFAEKNLPIP